MNTLFTSTVSSLFVLFIFIGIGVFLGRKQLLPDTAAATLSKLETYLFMPALSLRTCANQCSIENIREYLLYIGVAALSVIIFFFAANALSARFSKTDDERGIFTYALTVGNIGYMGQPLMLSVFGETMLMKYIVTCIPLNVYIYTLGLAMMARGKASFRSLINAPVIGIFLGMALGFLDIKLPAVVDSVLASAAACMSPLAMLIAGLAIAKLPFKKLFSDARAYIASLLRLVVFPALAVAVLALCRASTELITIVLLMFAMPIGMNTIVFPASKGVDSTMGAKLVLVSNILCLVTIPLMLLAFSMIFKTGV